MEVFKINNNGTSRTKIHLISTTTSNRFKTGRKIDQTLGKISIMQIPHKEGYLIKVIKDPR